MLRKTSIILNIIVVIISTSLFTYTFFAKNHLTEHARTFVTEKTLAYSKPVIQLAEKSLKSPITSKLIPSKQRKAIEKELSEYRAEPKEYIAFITKPQTRNTTQASVDKLGKIKQKIKDYYNSILKELITDLRIFTGSNVLAGLFALFLLFKKPNDYMRETEVFSFIIFATVAFSSWMYIDELSFFSILFKCHLGWAYPIGIVIISAYLFYKYLKNKTQVEH